MTFFDILFPMKTVTLCTFLVLRHVIVGWPLAPEDYSKNQIITKET